VAKEDKEFLEAAGLILTLYSIIGGQLQEDEDRGYISFILRVGTGSKFVKELLFVIMNNRFW